MKMKVFTGTIYEAVEAFNKWAKGKVLTRDVIIHTHVQFSDGENLITDYADIIVVHPEDPQWDKTETPQKTPIIDVPIPQTKIEEIKVTQ